MLIRKSKLQTRIQAFHSLIFLKVSCILVLHDQKSLRYNLLSLSPVRFQRKNRSNGLKIEAFDILFYVLFFLLLGIIKFGESS